ncbi:transposase [Rhodovulum sulfidophilum]|uniref:Transposase n=1 Tax=Rhodovulum sulfidophilum TaxID=35806 RepID=A0A0D6AY28_RHOSU|nr:transposase [Rhodovulum sulfidophilum]
MGGKQAWREPPTRMEQGHIAMDTGTGDIRATEFTSSRLGDSAFLGQMLDRIVS